MEDFGAEDLQQLWKFQDQLHDHARVLLKHGLQLGAMAFALELTLLLHRHNITIDAELIQKAGENAIKTGEEELNKRIGNARGTDTSEK